jgi:hypothetical protein
MTWNHRLLATEYESVGSKETYFQIHEVYYDEDGKPNGYTANPITIGGDSIDGLRWTVDRIKECLEKPILWGDDRFPEVYEPISGTTFDIHNNEV